MFPNCPVNLASFVKEVQPYLKDITAIQTVIDMTKQGKLTKVFSELQSAIKLKMTVPLSNGTYLDHERQGVVED